MKRFFSSIRLLLLVAILLIITGVSVFATTGKSTTDSLRIRKGPSTDSEVLNVLAKGDNVEILGEEGDWYKVSAKGHTGYVSKAYINKMGDSQSAATTQTPNNQTETPNNQTQIPTPAPENNGETNTIVTKVYKVAENTQVYILPVLSSNIIGSINAGESIDLVNSAGLWGYIKSSNITGWVRVDKLSFEEVVSTVSEPAQQQPAQQQQTQQQQTQQQQTQQEPAQQEPVSQATQQQQTTETNKTEPNKEQKPEENKPKEPAKTEEVTGDVAITEKTMYVNVSAVNVRKQPNTTSDVISGAGLNAQFTAVAENNGWYKIKTNGGFGYIRKDLLSDNKTEVTSRGNDVQREETKSNAVEQSAGEAQQTTTTQAATPTSTDQTASVPTSSSGVSGNDVIAYAKKFLGCKYVYGAAGPSSFDCSGFTMYVYSHFGYSLSHSSRVQATQGVPVNGDLQAGDILVFTNDGVNVGHVGLYIGNDKFIHASDSTTGVIISNLHDSWNIKKYIGARRIIK